MIHSKKELAFYIKADYMMNRGYFKPSLKQRLKNLIFPDYIMQFLVSMRKVAYYQHRGGISLLINKIRFKKLSRKLGFSIGPNVFGYGLVIPHWGTIVVGDSNRIGNYCVLHTSTCITDNKKEIGDALYVSAGSIITSKITLGNNVSIGAKSLVNKSFNNENILLTGSPASIKKQRPAWYIEEGKSHKERVFAIEKLKASLQ